MYITNASESYVQHRTLSSVLSTLNPNAASSLHFSTYIAAPNRIYSSTADQKKKIKNFFVNDEKIERKEKLPKASKTTKKLNSKNSKTTKGEQSIKETIENLIVEEMNSIEKSKKSSQEIRNEFEHDRFNGGTIESEEGLSPRYQSPHSRNNSRPSSAGTSGGRRKRITSGISLSTKRRLAPQNSEYSLNDFTYSLEDAEMMELFQNAEHSGNYLESSKVAHGLDINGSQYNIETLNDAPQQNIKSRVNIFSSEPKYGKPNQRNVVPQNIRSGDKKEMKKVLLNQFELTNVLTDQLSELKRKNKHNKKL